MSTIVRDVQFNSRKSGRVVGVMPDGAIVYPVSKFSPEHGRTYRVALEKKISGSSGNVYYSASPTGEPAQTLDLPSNDIAKLRGEIAQLTSDNEVLRASVAGKDEHIVALVRKNEMLSADAAAQRSRADTLEGANKRLVKEVENRQQRLDAASSSQSAKEIETLKKQLNTRIQNERNKDATIAERDLTINSLKRKLRDAEAAPKRPTPQETLRLSVDDALAKLSLEDLLGKHATDAELSKAYKALLLRIHDDKVRNLGRGLRQVFESLAKAVNAKYGNR